MGLLYSVGRSWQFLFQLAVLISVGVYMDVTLLQHLRDLAVYCFRLICLQSAYTWM